MEREVVAIFGAHPDDLDWSSGGTAAVWARAGKEVYYILTTSGESGEDHQRGHILPTAEIADIRETEQRHAATILGVKDVIFLGQPDGRVEPSLAFRDQIVNLIRRLKPHMVINWDPGHWAFDNFHLYHPDHRATALAVHDAVYPAAGTATYTPQPDAGLPPHKVREMYFSGTAQPDTYVDITSAMELKVQALLSHRSQIKDPERMSQLIREAAARHGEQAGCQYAEAFRCLAVPQ
ncbi:MAG: PIG-L family deacetylase [bacterium]|nr:PIG-L family deacetylase [bacterium]